MRRNLFGASMVMGSARWCSLNVSDDIRHKLTNSFNAVKEEAKGQALDLGDMLDSSKNAAKLFTATTKANSVSNEKFDAKVMTLNASLKAYNTKLANLQAEARALHSDIDALTKVLWGKASTSEIPAAPEQAEAKVEEVVESDFGVEPPTNKTVEAEVVSETRAETAETTTSQAQQSVDAEPIEIEIEETAESKSITDITSELHAKGIDFSDCMDAKSLRQRYQDVLDGKVKPPQKKPTPKPATPAQPQYSSPPQQQQQSYQQQQQQQTPNTTETGLAHDPHPGAQRKQVDMSKYVWEVKADIARDNNVTPDQIDLWAGMVKLDDHRRMYEFPQAQHYPIQVRSKGDAPTSY